MNINKSEYVVSNPDYSKCPQTNQPEFAFIGRSNVGKSSLINMLTGRTLAKTSATPGKTMLINHFIVDDRWYIVDLPGYGYARRSKDARDGLERMIRGYVLSRQQMTNLFVLVDSRHAPQRIDLEFITWLGENGVPFSLVFTKLDKLGINAGKRNIEQYKKALLEQWEELPPIFTTSSIDGRGRDEIIDYIEAVNKSLSV